MSLAVGLPKLLPVLRTPSPSSSMPFFQPFAAVAPGPAISTAFIHRLGKTSECVKSIPVSTMHTLTCSIGHTYQGCSLSRSHKQMGSFWAPCLYSGRHLGQHQQSTRMLVHEVAHWVVPADSGCCLPRRCQTGQSPRRRAH